MLDVMSMMPGETMVSTARVPACDVSNRQNSRLRRLRTHHGGEIKFDARKVDGRRFVGKKTKADRKATIHIRLHGCHPKGRIEWRQLNLEPTNSIQRYWIFITHPRLHIRSQRCRQCDVDKHFLVSHLDHRWSIIVND